MSGYPVSLKKKTLLFLVLISLFSLISQASSTTKGRVIQIDPNSVQYLANSFDQVLVFFLQQRHDQYELLFAQFVKDINLTYPDDHTLFAVTYFKNDTLGKLGKFNNKSDGFRIITRRNHYQMQFTHEIRQFQLLRKFYSSHIHPVLPVLIRQQLTSIDTEYSLIMQYDNQTTLKQYIKLYPKIYDYLRIFKVRAVALESTKNQQKLMIYRKPLNPEISRQPIVVATYGNLYNNTDQLIDFINVETLPYISTLDDQNYVRIFGSLLDTQFLFIYQDQTNKDSPKINRIRQQLTKVASYNREEQLKYQRILFAQSNTQFLSKYFDGSLRQMQNQKGQKVEYKLILTKTDYGKFQLRRFSYNEQVYGEPNKENILKFIEDVRMKKIDSQFQSQKIPTQEEQQKQILRKIVGKSFISEIFERPDESVVVLFIDSKQQQAHKQIKQAFEKFTQKYRDILKGKVVPAIFDLAKNQNKLLSIRTAPMLTLFERTNKKSPKNFKGYYKPESIKDWLNYEVKDLTIPQNYGEVILPLGAGSATAANNGQKIVEEKKEETQQKTSQL